MPESAQAIARSIKGLMAERRVSESACLAKAAGVPTDTKGQPKAGEWPNWDVTVDDDGLPTFTSTV